MKPDIFRIIEKVELFPLSVCQRLKNQRETYQEQKTILRILGRMTTQLTLFAALFYKVGKRGLRYCN